MKKIFYDQKWLAFEAPEKQRNPNCNLTCPDDFCVCYHEAYAEAKANALEVGNVEILKSVGYLDLKHDGDCFEWEGTAVIRDNKYYLEI